MRSVKTSNVKKGDTIKFYASYNMDKRLLKGVDYKEQLVLFTVVEEKQYELKKLITIRII